MDLPTPQSNLLGGPPPTLLPTDTAVDEAFAAGSTAEQVARSHPASPRAWAQLADDAFAAGEVVQSYAYARTGYHRGLDALRKNGWRGTGPVPWSHEANRGLLRSVYALGRAADAIGEADEAQRCAALLDDCDPAAGPALAGGREL